VTVSSLVTTFWVMDYMYKGPTFFIHNMGFMGIKRDRILRRFQKYKLTLVAKCTQKKLFKKKEFLFYTGGPCVRTTDENFYPLLGTFLTGAFVENATHPTAQLCQSNTCSARSLFFNLFSHNLTQNM
jgi:hypothetical protein